LFPWARTGLTRVTVVWRRELGVLGVNWPDILDGEIVNAAWAVAGMVAKPRTGRKVAVSLDTVAWNSGRYSATGPPVASASLRPTLGKRTRSRETRSRSG